MQAGGTPSWASTIRPWASTWGRVLVLLAFSLALFLLNPAGALRDHRLRATAAPLSSATAESSLSVAAPFALASSAQPSAVSASASAASFVPGADSALLDQAEARAGSTLHMFPRHALEATLSAAPMDGSVCALPEFGAASRPRISIYVFAWRRLTSLMRLLQSLSQAEYCGHEMGLTVLVDGGALASVVDYVKAFRWKHGPLKLLLQDEIGGEDETFSFKIVYEICMLNNTTTVSSNKTRYEQNTLKSLPVMSTPAWDSNVSSCCEQSMAHVYPDI